jgi:gluconolactonase
MNPVEGWSVDTAAITTTGVGLRRPECVVLDDDGSIWIADLAGLVCVRPDGSQFRLSANGGAGGPYAPPGEGLEGVDISANAALSLPNGFCMDGDDGFIICNFGTNVVERLGRDGSHEIVADRLADEPLGKCNFPVIDSTGRLWFSVTASAAGWLAGPNSGPSGYICVYDEMGLRKVADNLNGTNELRFDPAEEWLYVAETGGDHISRFRVGADGSLSDRQIYGPERLGGFPDGFCFDEAGNIWTTLIGMDRLVALTPQGEVITVWQDGKPGRGDALATSLGPRDDDGLAPRMASVNFVGPDRRTVVVGSLRGTNLPTFTAPVAGQIIPNRRWTRKPPTGSR